MSAQLPVRHRSTRWLKRRRRAKFRRRRFRAWASSEPALWAWFSLLGLVVVGIAIIVYYVLTKGGI